jgi:hypothetical protein
MSDKLRESINILWDRPCYKCRSHTCDTSCSEPRNIRAALEEPAIKESLTVAGEKHMNPSDKYEQIKDIKRLNPVELEAMVLKHDQQIKDLAAHLREKND